MTNSPAHGSDSARFWTKRLVFERPLTSEMVDDPWRAIGPPRAMGQSTSRVPQFQALIGSSTSSSTSRDLERSVGRCHPRGRQTSFRDHTTSSARSTDLSPRSHDLERWVTRVTPLYPSDPRPLGRHRRTFRHREIWTPARSRDASIDVGHPSREMGDRSRDIRPYRRAQEPLARRTSNPSRDVGATLARHPSTSRRDGSRSTDDRPSHPRRWPSLSPRSPAKPC